MNTVFNSSSFGATPNQFNKNNKRIKGSSEGRENSFFYSMNGFFSKNPITTFNEYGVRVICGSRIC